MRVRSNFNRFLDVVIVILIISILCFYLYLALENGVFFTASITWFLKKLNDLFQLLTPFNGIIIGAAIALIFRLIYDLFKSPTLKYNKISGPQIISFEDPHETGKFIGAKAYRIRIVNKKKFLANSAAENCICWFNIDGAEETFHLPWISDGESISINVDDYREIDFCARLIANGSLIKQGWIIFPSVQGYNKSFVYKDGTHPVTGQFRVTSSNGKKEERKFTIIPIEKNQLKIEVDT